MTVKANISEFFEAWKEGHYSKKILVEGDSWVSHPFPGVENLATQIDSFRSNEYLLLNIAAPGDEAKEIFEPNGKQMKRLKRLLNTERWGEKFDLIILSAAGNDIVGEEIRKKGYVMNKRDYPELYGKKLLTCNFYNVIDRIVDGYRHFFKVKESNKLNKETPVLSHSYSYMTPREIGTHIGPIKFNNGWIKIHLDHQGIKNEDEQYEIIVEMLDAFYRAMKPLESEYLNFIMVDTREVLLKNGKPNLDLWHDEIHPNRAGFGLVAEHIRAVARNEGLWLKS